MGLNKSSILRGLAAVPIIAATMGASPVFAYNVNATGQVEVGCNDLQEAINSGPALSDTTETVAIVLNENCNKDVVIPSGRHIALYVSDNHDHSSPDSHRRTLSNVSGDTVTVENGATFVLMAGYLANNTSGKAVINNKGTSYINANSHSVNSQTIDDVALMAQNDAHLFANSGTLNISHGVYDDFSIVNTGTVRIAGGKYGNGSISNYLVNGCTLNNSFEVSCENWQQYLEDVPVVIPVGAKTTITYKYPELAEATGHGSAYSSDTSIISVEGSAFAGYTVTAKKTGQAMVAFPLYGLTIGTGIPITTYNVINETDSASDTVSQAVKDYLANGLDGETLSKIATAVTNGETISVDVEAEAKNVDTVTNDEQEKINSALGEDDGIAGYYDIGLVISGSESGVIKSITDLGDDEDDTVTVKLKLPDEFVDEPSAGSIGYKTVYYVVRLHNDGTTTKVDKITATNLGDGYITFKTGKFSTYAVAYTYEPETTEEASEADSATASNSSATSPNTGAVTAEKDGAVASITGIVAAIVAILASVAFAAKKFSRETSK